MGFNLGFKGLKVFVRYPADLCYFQRLLPELRYNLCCNLLNKTNLMHDLLLAYLSISTCFGRLCAHHQEKQLCLYDTWYLFCVEDYLVCRVESTLHTRQSSIQNNKYQVSHKHSCFSWWWAHSRPKHVEINKYNYTKKQLYTKLVLFTRLYTGAQSAKDWKCCVKCIM